MRRIFRLRKLIYLARNNADEHAKQRLMPIVRDLIQKVVIGKTPGHQPASLQLHGSSANIMASMEVRDLVEQQFLAAARYDFMSTGVRRTGHGSPKRKTLLGVVRRSFVWGWFAGCLFVVILVAGA